MKRKANNLDTANVMDIENDIADVPVLPADDGAPLSNAEIRHFAAQRIARRSGDSISLMIYQFSIVALILLCEATLYLLLRSVGYTWLYSIKELLELRGTTWLFWISKSMFEFTLASPFFNLVRRLYLDIAMGSDLTETRKYVAAHSVKYYSNSFYASFIQLMLKLIAITPAFITAYSAHYWVQIIRLSELTSGALLSLMASLSMTAVWLFLAIRYYISLALTPYIMALNPRSNVYDACDLSIRLMDGKHGRYISFMAHFIKFIPAMLLVYPYLAIYPYFKVSYSMFVRELLGERNQDKLPGMIKRWKKYM
ncbi:MAG: hypothetical protein J5582_07910 [Ruminococcus sp.]|nr:hypothetical protein [Ruminococcus sp.]